MINFFKDWYCRKFSDPEAIVLVLVIFFTLIMFSLVGRILSPLITSIIVAYLLDDTVAWLTRHKLPRTVSVVLTCIFFVGILYTSLFLLFPLLWEQLSHLFEEIPKINAVLNDLVTQFNQRYPDIISVDQMKQLIVSFKSELGTFGHAILTYSISSVTSVISVFVYMYLVPIMVFFLLLDKLEIINWFSKFIPERRRLISQIWYEVDAQIGKYIRAKLIEIIIVTITMMIVFSLFGLKYAFLLAVLSGLSVLIPYVGVVSVTIPIFFVALLQWGFVSLLGYFTLTYLILMFLDGEVLAMLLFSDAVKLHPIAVIVSILFFGSLWGVWGVFFAIPLATVVKAIINAFVSLNPGDVRITK